MTISWKVTLMLVVMLIVGIAAEEARVRAGLAREQRAVLATANAIAERDSTHDLLVENARVAKVAGDSLRLVEKRVVQVRQTRDALDAALRREKKGSYTLSTHVESVYVERRAPVVGRSAAFHIRNEPYTADADVELPPPPDSATLRLHIALDTMPMRIRLTCNGRMDARIVVEAPTWARVMLGAVTQDPTVCATRERAPRSTLRWQMRPVIGGGRVLTGAGSGWGAFVGLGLTHGFDE